MNEFDNNSNAKGSLSYYAVLLEDPTTEIKMNVMEAYSSDCHLWEFKISTPEDPCKVRAWGNWRVVR